MRSQPVWPRSQVPALWIPNRCHSHKGEAKAIHSSEKSPGSWSLAMYSEDPRYSPIPDSLASVYYTPAIVFVGVTPAFPVVGTECNTRQDSVPLRAKEATPPGRGRCGSLGPSLFTCCPHRAETKYRGSPHMSEPGSSPPLRIFDTSHPTPPLSPQAEPLPGWLVL